MQHRHASRLAHPLLRRRFRQTAVAAAAATLLISACGGGDSNGGSGTTPSPQNLNAKPDFIVGTISVKSYDRSEEHTSELQSH